MRNRKAPAAQRGREPHSNRERARLLDAHSTAGHACTAHHGPPSHRVPLNERDDESQNLQDVAGVELLTVQHAHEHAGLALSSKTARWFWHRRPPSKVVNPSGIQQLYRQLYPLQKFGPQKSGFEFSISQTRFGRPSKPEKRCAFCIGRRVIASVSGPCECVRSIRQAMAIRAGYNGAIRN